MGELEVLKYDGTVPPARKAAAVVRKQASLISGFFAALADCKAKLAEIAKAQQPAP